MEHEKKEQGNRSREKRATVKEKIIKRWRKD